MGIADGSVCVDGREIYTATDLRVGLFQSTDNFNDTTRRSDWLGHCLEPGNNASEVTDSLRNGKSGITYNATQEEIGMRLGCRVSPILIYQTHRPQAMAIHGRCGGLCLLSMEQAIADSGLTPEQVSNVRTGIIAGSGGASSASQVEAADILRERGLRRVGPYRVTQTMGSTVSACLATPFQIKGVNYSISSACSTSAHCIGNAMEQNSTRQTGRCLCGRREELDWS